jgi:glutamine amidotransferase
VKVGLFDYGAGNLHSLAKALESGGAEVEITASWDQVLSADALVLPGVGSFGAAVRALEGHEDRVRMALEEGLPCLGICLGMQLLFDSSEEGKGKGIGVIPGRVRRLRSRVVPHMGWNDVNVLGDSIFEGIGPMVAYYANSFVCRPKDESVVIATTEYQGDTFSAAVRRKKTWGVQFHPEKSSAPGLRLIRNFLNSLQDLPRALKSGDEP